MPGFAEAMRSVHVTVGSAFELPITLAAGRSRDQRRRCSGVDRARSGAQPDCGNGVAGRGGESADERAQLSRSGAARARRVADQHRQHAAVRRNVGRTRAGNFGRQPAQLLEQLHRRWAVRQRRCGGTERHSLRRRCRRSISGRDLRRAGRAGSRTRRLHQRRHQERNEPVHGDVYGYFRDDSSMRPMRFRGTEEAADDPEAVRRQPWRSARRETGRSTSRTSSSAGWTRPG